MLSCVLGGTGLSLRAFRFPLEAAAAGAEETPMLATLFPIVHPTNPTVSALTMLFVVVVFFCLILCFATSAEPSRGGGLGQSNSSTMLRLPLAATPVCGLETAVAKNTGRKSREKSRKSRAEWFLAVRGRHAVPNPAEVVGGSVGRRRKAPPPPLPTHLFSRSESTHQ